MIRILLPVLLLPFLVLFVPAEEAWRTCCAKHDAMRASYLAKAAAAAAPSAAETNIRQYAPDREIDVLHLKLDVTPNFEQKTIAGTSELRFKPIAKSLKTLRLDSVDLAIDKVESSAAIAAYNIEEEHLVITFEKPLKPNVEASVTVTYHGEPEQGLYFRTPDMGYPETDTQLWTQGEPERHRFWYPGYDYPNERFATEIVCHVPEGMVVLSNGTLLSEKTKDGTNSFHWLQKQPHVNYLVSLIAGHFERIESTYKSTAGRDLELAFITPPSEISKAKNSFRDTAKILRFFEDELGVPYPWDKYYNVCVHDFIAGGMENTSITTLTLGTLFDEATENLRSSRGLDAHEIAHQWFGDLVTCKDWSHLWLNEGFATYYTELYEEAAFDTDHLRYNMWNKRNSILNNKDEKPMVWRGYTNPWDQFDYRAYPKGSWVLHMLRSQLGPDLYRRCVTTYLKRNADNVAVTEDLNRVFSELSGRDFDRFFDQWVYHGGEPAFKIGYRWNEGKKEVKFTVEQTQKVSDKVLMFDVPLPVRIVTKDGVRNEILHVTRKKEDFEIRLPSKPELVRVDPELSVLASYAFTPPNPLLHAQLERGDDMIGRLEATKILGGRKDKDSIARLKKRLNEDAFYGVRVEAAKSLEKTHTPEALAALLDSRKQSDARVRREVVRALGKFYTDECRDALLQIARKEKNPEIVSAALRGLGKYHQPEVRKVLVAALGREAYRHEIARSAIRAMRDHDDPELAPMVLTHLKKHTPSFTTRGLSESFEQLAFLARDVEGKTPYREFLLGSVNDPRERVQISAVKALGVLGDDRAIAVLESFRHGATEGHLKTLNDAANGSLNSLRSDKAPSQELKDVRKKLGELESMIKELKKAQETKK